MCTEARGATTTSQSTSSTRATSSLVCVASVVKPVARVRAASSTGSSNTPNTLDPDPLMYHDGNYTRLLAALGGDGLTVGPLPLPDPLDEDA